MPRILHITSAGFMATAISFGPARIGFGLFLPTFRDSFTISTTQAGFIASLAFCTFLIALPAAAWLDERSGPRSPILLGCILATIGFFTVAVSSHVLVLSAGIALAATSAGLCWSPFNDAAKRMVPGRVRPGVLSTVATGTAIGVALTGLFFLSVSSGTIGWRPAWAVFAAVGALAAITAWYGVPAGRENPSGRQYLPNKRMLFRKSVVPVYIAACGFGLCNAIYISFAADYVVAEGGLSDIPSVSAAAILFLAYGIFGLFGLLTGRLEERIGLGFLLSLIFAAFTASLVLVALYPSLWGTVILSAGLHGAAVMMISAVLSFWSLRLFPDHGSFGFTAALVVVAASNALSPPVSGLIADKMNMSLGLLAGAVAPALVMVIFFIRAVFEHIRLRNGIR